MFAPSRSAKFRIVLLLSLTVALAGGCSDDSGSTPDGGAVDSRAGDSGTPNALFPLITVLALDFALLFSGAVVTETVFAWPGMGTLLLDSVYRRDYSVLMGILMAASVVIIVSNLVADVAYGWLDPRVRLLERKDAA